MNTFRDLILYCLKKWYWFLIAIVICCALGVVYYFSTTLKYETSLSYHPRENEQGRMFSNVSSVAEQTMAGVGNFVRVTDEQEKLNSHAVMRATVQDLGLQYECRKKVGLRWIGQYPEADFAVQFLDLDSIEQLPYAVNISLKKTSKGYNVKVKQRKESSKHKLVTLTDTLETVAGRILITEVGEEVKNGNYRLKINTLAGATDDYCDAIQSDRVDDDNHILCIAAVSDMPKRTEDVINGMVRNYNAKVIADKHDVAQKVDAFLAQRIDQTYQEIADIKADTLISIDEQNYRIAGKEEGLRMLMQRKEENAFAMVYAIEPLNVIDPVYTTVKPIAPKWRKVLLVSGVFGIAIAVIGLYIKDLFAKKGK